MAHDDDFWSDLISGQHKVASSIDDYLSDKKASPLMRLTDRGREEASLQSEDLTPGLRVSFLTNIGSVLSYPNPPDPETQGTIVVARTSEGDTTNRGDLVFVKWDDGKFMATHRHHIQRVATKKVARGLVRKVSSLGDLSDFLKSGSKNELVHKATKDLWSLHKTEAGDYIIARLFNEDGEPIKV